MSSREELDHGRADGSGASNHDDAHEPAFRWTLSSPTVPRRVATTKRRSPQTEREPTNGKAFADGARHGLPSSVVDIVELDAAALADDAVMRDYYDLSRRAELLGREQAPFWTFEEFVGAFRSEDSGERQQLFAAYDGDRMIACAVLWSFLLDNTDKAWFEPRRRPARPPRGCRPRDAGADRAGRQGRRPTLMLIADTKLPFDERETHGYRQFADACGYELSNYEVVRHLPLPVPDEQIQEWVDEAAARHEGYTIETFVDEVPDDLVESLCVLLGQLAVDAPTGAVDFEEEAMTPERYAEMVATTKAMGRARYETLALTPDRLVVAQSTLAVPAVRQHDVFQWGTFVHREHRGHQLGLADEGRQPAGGPGAPRRPHAGHHPERRDQRLHGLDQRADGLRAGRGVGRVRQAPLTDGCTLLARPQLRRTATGRRGATTASTG